MQTTIYDTNATMNLLGEQDVTKYLEKGGLAAEEFMEMLTAHRAQPDVDLFGLAMDAFALGMIYGKREERKQKTN